MICISGAARVEPQVQNALSHALLPRTLPSDGMLLGAGPQAPPSVPPTRRQNAQAVRGRDPNDRYGVDRERRLYRRSADGRAGDVRTRAF